MSRAMHVAIVDDEQDMRQSISQWLALSGFKTETYADGAEAIAAIDSDFPRRRHYRYPDAGTGWDGASEADQRA